jgi:hypothetical protein
MRRIVEEPASIRREEKVARFLELSAIVIFSRAAELSAGKPWQAIRKK